MPEQATSVNPNSALYWYPRLDDVASSLPVDVPETRFVEYDFVDSIPLMEGTTLDTLPWSEFVEAAADVGWPAFLRTDQKSVKHAGPGAYRAEEPDDIPTILAVLTDHHVKANRNPAALMVREFVDLNAAFRAFDGLPIGRELRVFASPEAVECDHYYWPAEAIEDGRGTPTAIDGSRELDSEEWRNRLETLSVVSGNDRDTLHDAAQVAATALNADSRLDTETAWSVDFAQDHGGDWWLIDVALAEDSWHPDNCEEDLQT